MKKFAKIITWLLVIFIVIFIFCSVIVGVFGKKMIISQIEQNLKVKADLEKISFGFPFSVNLSGLEIGNLLRAKEISATPSILGFFAGKVVLSGLTVVDPVVNLEQEKDGRLNLPVFEQKGNQPPVLLAGLVVRNGRFVFSDKKIAGDYKVILEKINADISKVKFPLTSLNAKFKLSADFVKPDAKKFGNIRLEGWVDFGPKDMDAVLEVKDLDIVYFAPYCGDFLSGRELLSAKLDFSCALKAKNNELNIASRLKLSNLVYAQGRPPEEGGRSGADFSKSALDFFADNEGNVGFDFTVNTKLDNPKLNPKELKRVMLEAAMRNLSRQSPQEIIEKITTNIEQFKEMGKQLKDIFRGKGE